MHLRNKCIHCNRTMDTETYTCIRCKSEDVEEIYTVVCDICKQTDETNIGDPCVSCENGIYEEDEE